MSASLLAAQAPRLMANGVLPNGCLTTVALPVSIDIWIKLEFSCLPYPLQILGASQAIDGEENYFPVIARIGLLHNQIGS